MKHQLLACSLLSLLAATTGCAICSSPFDYTYSTHGGKWEREDETSGRVGSLLEPAGPMPMGSGVAVAPAAVPATAPSPEPAAGPATSQDAKNLSLPAARSADAAPMPGVLIQ